MIAIRKLYKKRFPRWVVPSFFIGMTILIMIFNDVFGEEDAFIVFSLFFFMTMAVVVTRWLFFQVKSILKLKKEKKQAELLHLKSQVNPHFFFNMLNNLYGLVEKDTGKAQQLILSLSDLMRYSIYEGQNDKVILDEEIVYLENYIKLHKMRYHKTIDIQFDIEVADKNVKVMPLLFIILLENAFKHGVENLREGAFVFIKLVSSKSQIEFEIENNFDPEELKESNGIGLRNLKRRLELMYPDKHELNFLVDGDIYKAQLMLQI